MVGKGSSKSERTALKALPTNTKRLVGRGSPRIPTVGKGQVCVDVLVPTHPYILSAMAQSTSHVGLVWLTSPSTITFPLRMGLASQSNVGPF